MRWTCVRPCLRLHSPRTRRLANLDVWPTRFRRRCPRVRAKLRLAAPEVLDAARSLGLGVTELVVKATTSPVHPSERADPKVKPMSAAARDALQAALASLKDPEPTGPEDPS